MKLTTTLKLLKEHGAPEGYLTPLLHYIGHDYDENKEINLLTILESNGAGHCVQAFKTLLNDKTYRNVFKIISELAEDVFKCVSQYYKNIHYETVLKPLKNALDGDNIFDKINLTHYALEHTICIASDEAEECEKQAEMIKKYLTWE